MRRSEDKTTANKIYVILSGMETITSAERSVVKILKILKIYCKYEKLFQTTNMLKFYMINLDNKG